MKFDQKSNPKFDPIGFVNWLESSEGEKAQVNILARENEKSHDYKKKREAYLLSQSQNQTVKCS